MKMKRNKVTIFIDESGTLPDSKDKIIVVAAVGTDLSNQLLNISRKIRKRLRRRKKKEKISEIKFYQAGERTKLDFLKELSRSPIDIFVLVVDKKGQKIPDTPLNFAVLSYILLEECIIFYGDQISRIVFDKHFHQDKNEKEFNRILLSLLKRKLLISHVDSLDDIKVNAADMVAGSALWAYTGKRKMFYELLSDKIISEKILNWKEVKNKFYQKFKKLH